MAEENNAAATGLDQLQGQGQGALARSDFNQAVMGAAGDPEASKRATVQNPSSVLEMGNPYAGEVLQGSARISTKDLIARSKGVQTGSQDGGGQTAGGGAGVQGQGDRASQAEIDRLKSMVSRLEADALLGRHVKSDPLLFQKVTDSMSGQHAYGTQYPVQGADGRMVAIPAQGQSAQGAQPAKTLKERLGLAPDWTPLWEEVDIPGSDTFRWNQEKIREEARSLMNEENQKRATLDLLNQERQLFLGQGHSEQDLNSLLLWMSDERNFSLTRLWNYMKGPEMMQNATEGTRQQTQQQFQPSVSAVNGGGVIQAGELPENVLGGKLLELAELNKNPLLQ